MFTFRFTLILSSKHAQQKQQPKSMQVRRRSERSSTGSSDSVSSSILSYSQNIVSFIKKIAYSIIKRMSTNTLYKQKLEKYQSSWQRKKRCHRFIMRIKMKTLLHVSLNVTDHATIN